MNKKNKLTAALLAMALIVSSMGIIASPKVTYAASDDISGTMDNTQKKQIKNLLSVLFPTRK